MDNNKRKPKLVAEHPAACRRCRDGDTRPERQTWRPGYTRYVIANRCCHWLRKSSGSSRICLKLRVAFITTDGMGCKIRHGIGLQQVGPKPLIQAADTGKCAKLSDALIIVCLDFARPLSLPHQHLALIRPVYGYMLAIGIG